MTAAGLSLEAPDAPTTAAIGEAFGRAAPEGAVLLLSGPLGAGKTTFAQGVGRGCGVAGPIASPTYNLILVHAGERPFTHVDLYRLDDAAALETLDLDAILSASGVVAVEWPELLEPLVRPPAAEIAIAPGPGPRRLEIAFRGPGWETARAAAEAAAR